MGLLSSVLAPVLFLVFFLALTFLFLFLFLFLWKRPGPCAVLRTIPTEDGTIEIVPPTCMEGLPHTTTSNIIRMTEETYANIGKEKDNVLTHERVHLSQKRHPAQWEAFYRDAWEYELLANPPPDLPAHHRENLRPNPDTAGKPWALWRGRYLFFPEYTESRTLRGAVVRVWDTQTHQLVPVPSEWKAAFCGEEKESGGCPHQYEHPHEMAAEYVARK